MLNKKIKAFTLAEMLVTLALTSVIVTFSYLGLRQMQKLLYQYNDQSFFITQLNELNKRVNSLCIEAHVIQKSAENKLIFKTDSTERRIEFNPDFILTFKNNKTDTFKLKNNELKVENEVLGVETQSLLVKKVEFDIYFQKQKFHLIFIKNYDAFSKLMIETSNGNN